MARRIVCRCRPRPSSPTHAMSAAYSRSSLRSKQPPPTARHVGPHGPEPSAPHGSGPQERICSSSCLSWLHLLKSCCLLYTSDAADDLLCVDLGGRRIIK